MTDELTKTFFETFGIPPLCCKKYLTNCVRYDCENCENFDNTFSTYPQITDRILLGLICILTKHYDYADQNWLTKCNDIKELKVSVLRLLLLCTSSIIEKYKHQVQALFKENN